MVSFAGIRRRPSRAGVIRLRRRCARHLHELSRTALAELADTELEERVAARFAEALGALEPSVPARWPRPRARLAQALQAQLGEDLETHHARAEDLVLDIPLRAEAQVLESSLASCLDRFQAAVAEKLDEVRTARGAGGVRGCAC